MKKNGMKISNLLRANGFPNADQSIVERMPQLEGNELQFTDANELHVTSDINDSTIFEVSIHDLDVSPFQPRINFDDNELQTLADSISTGTLIDPITIRKKDNNRYELISGERRYRAHIILGYEKIPAVIKILDDKQSALLSIASNTVRENLSDFELGRSFKKLLDSQYVRSVSELSRYIGISRQQIDRCLDFTKLPISVIDQLEKNPKLFGANCAEFFAGYILKGYVDNVILAVDMIVNGASEQKAMFWLRSQSTSSTRAKKTRKNTPLFYDNKQIGTAYIEGKKIIIECSTGSQPSFVLESLLNKYVEN
ncbi:ParB/RepB/Spo0J family partition protein [Methylovulum psychrotolerans]|uniref:ParB/RepB/Spo0J family partition protein n=2 Tax=Methylovulum psychrotolerans TaxID=1704499 RepID=UPI001BFF3AA0|nr:ParB/RepB/Spo0J family partition protein [Methylovulum psychrotolerans]